MVSDPIDELRGLAAAAPSPPAAMAGYLAKVHEHAYRITDGDVEALKQVGARRGRDLRAHGGGGARRGPAPARAGGGGDRMRLAVVDAGHAPDEAAVLAQIRARTGGEPLGVVKTLLYRPELFGRPFSDALDRVMRGPSDWSSGERELFAGFTSLLNQCPF